jgi:hypothetical protein
LLECPLYDVSGRGTRRARVNLIDLAHLDVLRARMTFQPARIRQQGKDFRSCSNCEFSPVLSKSLASARPAYLSFATPSLAQRSENHLTSEREQALHECNGAAAKYKQYIWDIQEIDIYPSCTANHGQQE